MQNKEYEKQTSKLESVLVPIKINVPRGKLKYKPRTFKARPKQEIEVEVNKKFFIPQDLDLVVDDSIQKLMRRYKNQLMFSKTGREARQDIGYYHDQYLKNKNILCKQIDKRKTEFNHFQSKPNVT